MKYKMKNTIRYIAALLIGGVLLSSCSKTVDLDPTHTVNGDNFFTKADDYDLALYRKRIETVYSQLQAMGVQQLHARTNLGFDLKAWASLLALAFTNIISI